MLKKPQQKQITTRENMFSTLVIRRVVAYFVMGICALTVMSCAQRDDASQLPTDTDIQSIESAIIELESGDDGFAYSVWLGTPEGEAWYSRNAQAIMPAASAIKTAILIEFFNDKADVLDQPFAELNALLDNPDAKAIAHFSPEMQLAARTELRGLTARQLAEAMVHKQHIETNAAYNAAANIITEYFGGPQALTERIHRRFPGSHDLVLARYMLADRQKNDDNLLSAHALAAVLSELANSPQAEGLHSDIRAEIRSVLWLENDDARGDHFYKGGSLSSMPQVRIEAGWWEKNCAASVYVVIAVNPLQAGNAPNYDKLRGNLAQLSKLVQDTGIDIRNTKQGKCSHAQ